MRNDETSRSKVKPLLALPVWEQWVKKCYFCLGDKLQFSYDNRLAVYFILNLVRPPRAQAYRNLEKVNVCKAGRVDKSGSEKAVRPYTQTAISKNFKKKEKSIKSALLRWIVVLARTNNRKFLESF